MDRNICRVCRHSGFSSTSNRWTGCSYILDTGEKRPHDGDMCYGFEPIDEKAAKTAAKLLRKAEKSQKTDEKVRKSSSKPQKTPEIPAPVSVYDGFRMWLNIMMS